MQIVPYAAEMAPWLERLFLGDRPIPTRLWAILDGITQGRILVDELTHPTFALVQDLAEGPAYLGGAMTPAALGEAFAIARRHQEVVVCLWPDDPLASALPEGPQYQGVAIHRAGMVCHQLAGRRTPPGADLRPSSACRCESGGVGCQVAA